MPRGPGRFFEELKQRGVLRTAGLYVVGAWLAIQVADTTFPHLQLPPWTVTAVIVAAIVGLPVVLALSWSFDLTPARFRNDVRAEGVRTGGRQPRAAPVRAHGWC